MQGSSNRKIVVGSVVAFFLTAFNYTLNIIDKVDNLSQLPKWAEFFLNPYAGLAGLILGLLGLFWLDRKQKEPASSLILPEGISSQREMRPAMIGGYAFVAGVIIASVVWGVWRFIISRTTTTKPQAEIATLAPSPAPSLSNITTELPLPKASSSVSASPSPNHSPQSVLDPTQTKSSQPQEGKAPLVIRYIIGNVSDSFNVPIGKAEIEALNEQTKKTYRTASKEGNGSGAFSFALPIGFYTVTIAHPSYIKETLPFNVTEKETDDPIVWNIELQRNESPDDGQSLGEIQGIIEDESGQRVQGVHITVRSVVNPTQLPLEDTSDSSGQFHFRDVSPGRYIIAFEHAKFKKKTVECDTRKGSRCHIFPKMVKSDK